jgi:predicted ArsR family transcriptional regulator
MSVEVPNSDADLLNLIRITGPLTVPEMSHGMEVTATAVRQRLTRLMSQTLIQREAVRAGRGRPKHYYSLTDKGLRQTGSNFSDLALVLWREFQSLGDERQRLDMLRRIVRALAKGYANEIEGNTPAERLQSLANLLNQRRIPVSVESSSPDQPTLTAHACPYPKLAEEDRNICVMEKMLFSELVGNDVELTQCRLDGGADCRFQTH